VSGLGGVVVALLKALVAFEPDTYSGEDCAVIAEQLAVAEKACAAARARAAVRAAASYAHRRRGYVDASDWVAATAGSTIRHARTEISTARKLGSCPATRAALLVGEISLAQAGEIVQTEMDVPGTEAELLRLAKHGNLGAVRERARKRRVEALPVDELHKHQVRSEEFGHWRDELGMVRFAGGLRPELGVPFVNRLDGETDRIWRAARREGREVTRARCAAEAFAKIIAGKGGGRSRGPDAVFTVDLREYRSRRPGAAAHLVGGGPVPVDVVRDLVADDAFLKVVFHDGVQIHTMSHLGRNLPAVLRSALELGAPPDFDGVTCSVSGCGRRYGLQWDHIDPCANGGPTSYANSQPLCYPHHQEKTKRDRKAGLLNGRDENGRSPP